MTERRIFLNPDQIGGVGLEVRQLGYAVYPRKFTLRERLVQLTRNPMGTLRNLLEEVQLPEFRQREPVVSGLGSRLALV